MRRITCRSFLLSDKRYLALVATFLAGMGQGVVSPEMPEMVGSGHGSLAITIGLGAFLLYAGIFFSSFYFSKLADQGKVNRLLTGGLWIYGLTLLGFSLTPPLWLLMVLRFVEGVSISAVLVSADYLLGRLSPVKERGLWLSFYGVALSVGLLLGPMMTLVFSLVTGLLVVAGCVFFISLFSFREMPLPSMEESVAAPFFSSPLLIAALYGFLEASLVAIVPLIALDYFHQKPQWILVAAILAAALASVPLGLLGDRFSPGKIVMLLLGGLVLGNFFYGVVWHLAFPWAWMPLFIFTIPVFFGILCGGFYPLGFAWLLEGYSGDQYGLASGRFTRYYGAGSLAGPLLLSFVYDRFGLSGFFFSLSGAGLVVWYLTVIWMKRKK